MPTHEVSIRKATSSQDDLKRNPEHCSVDAGVLRTIGRTVGQQIRVLRGPTDYALYTISESRDEGSAVVRMGLGGRRKLGTSGEAAGVIDTVVPHPTLDDGAAETRSEFVERLDDDRPQRTLIVIAPHGGDIEPGTDRQAERVRECLAPQPSTVWRCKGWRDNGGALRRWHITSTEIDPESFPRLGPLMARRFIYGVAFHGHGLADEGIIVGGAAPRPLKQEICRAIASVVGDEIDVRIARREDRFGGDDPCNIVNRLTVRSANGIQIEQSATARERYGSAIAEAVAAVYRPRLRFCEVAS